MKIDINMLIAAVQKTPKYGLPEMNEGTSYLHKTFYKTLATGEDVLFSEINFDAFENEDIGNVNQLHSNVFNKNYYEARGIASTLDKITPVCKTTAYV